MDTIYSLFVADPFDHDLMNWVAKIYNSSFPEEERRPFNHLVQLLKDSAFLQMYIIGCNDKNVGFITIWTFDTFIYIEHFAVHADHRNGGAGSFALDELARISPRPIILEVEPPVSELQRRRVFFYERAGFKLWPDFPYLQPAYQEGGTPIRLMLMTCGDIDLRYESQHILPLIYRQVYNAEPLYYDLSAQTER